YNAITLGNGWNTPLGAISFDATRSSSKLNNDITHEGTSYQVAYNKYLVQTATRFSVAAWRYASQDYRTFSDHLYENDKHNHHSEYDDFYDIGRKNSLSANIMQPLSTGIKIALNDEQNLFCTITFKNVIDENKIYICQ
ncbi:fimbria/pilus outer membrane usher protein, partial [Escherichia coli]|nr:fimbria/pilus outer membrane usher protein [Escherichia coli]